jgi:hypothetical protein
MERWNGAQEIQRVRRGVILNVQQPELEKWIDAQKVKT